MIKSSFVRACVTTLVLLAIYRVGNFIPLPGLNLDVLSSQGGGERFSINALGVVPWLSALMIVELLAILLPQRFGAKFTSKGHARPFSFEVVVLALFFSAVQGGGISIAFMELPGLVSNSAFLVSLTTSITLTAGCAVVMVFAQCIEQYGIGHGFWIMVVASSISAVLPQAQQLSTMLQQGAINWPHGFALLATDIAIIAAVVALLRARRAAGFASAEPLVWPLLFAPLVAGWLVALFAFAGPQEGDFGVLNWLTPGNPIGLLLQFLIIMIFSFRYALREGSNVFIVPSFAVAFGAIALEQASWFLIATQPLLGGANAVIVGSLLYTVVQEAKVSASLSRQQS